MNFHSTIRYSMKTNRPSIIDLVVLSILLKQPMNAYQLVQFIDEQQLSRLLKISTPAIYKRCRAMFEQNKLSGRLVRDGEAPEKMVYSVNDAGMDYFLELMKHFSENVHPFFMDINSVIYGLEHLKEDDALELIDAYMSQIKMIHTGVKIHAKEKRANRTFAIRMIIQQYIAVTGAIVDWIELVRQEFVKSAAPK